MTTEYDLDEILRRAMHAAVDQVEPAGDGLQQIRRQLARPRLRLQVALLLTETADLIRLIGIRLEPAASRALGLLRQAWDKDLLRQAWDKDLLQQAWDKTAASVRQLAGAPAGPASGRPRHGPAHRSRPPGRLAGTIAWLRPAIAVAAAVVIVVAGVFTLYTLRQTVYPISLLTGGGQSPAATSPAPQGTRHTTVPGITVTSPRSTPHTKSKRARHHASPVPSCTPGGPASAAPSPTTAPSPTDSPTASPSPSDTVAPSPSGSGSAAPISPAPPAPLGAGGGTVQPTSGC